jgi:chorismate synthase
LPAGLAIDIEAINADLSRRQKRHRSRSAHENEHDRALIQGGVMGGLTTGAPLA